MTGLFEFGAAIPDLPLFLILTLFGFAVGILSGLFGVGGGFIMTPLLNVLFGVPYNVAVGSCLSFTVGTSTTGVMRHWRLGNVGPKGVLILAAGAISGAILGTMFHEYLLRSLATEESTHHFDLAMQLLFIAVLIPTAALVYRGVGTLPASEGGLLSRLRLPPYIRLRTARIWNVSLPGFTALGIFTGFLAGLLGVGGGVFLVPMLTLLVAFRPHVAVGTSLGVVLFSSITGTITHGLHGNVNLPIALALLVGSTLGAQVGATICQRLHAPNLQRYFAFLILAVVLLLAWKSVVMIG